MVDLPPHSTRIAAYSDPRLLAAAPSPEDEVQPGRDFKDYLRIILRQYPLVLAAVAVSMAVAVYKAYTSAPEYRSAAVIQMSDARAALTGGLGAVLAGKVSDPARSQIEILRSRTVLGRVVDDEGLRLRPAEPGSLPHGALATSSIPADAPSGAIILNFDDRGVTAQMGAASAQAAYGDTLDLAGIRFAIKERPEGETLELHVVDRESALSELQYALGTAMREGTDIVDVYYTAPDPIQAQRVTNAVIDRFRSFSAGQGQDDARRRRLFLEAQVAAADSSLRDAQAALTQFRAREQVYSSRDRYVSQQVELMDLRKQLDDLRAERQTYESLLASLRPGMNNSAQVQTVFSVPGMASNPVLSGLFAQLNNYQIARDTMTVGRWGSAATNPDVARIDSLIASTQEKLRGALRSQISATAVSLTVLQEQERRAATAMQAAPQIESEEVRLVAKAEQLGNVVEEVREMYEQARIEEAVEVGQVNIIDQALPGQPQATTRIATLMMGLIFGLALGGGLALVRDASSTSLRRREGVEDLLQVPELAVVPRGAHASRSGTSLSLPVANGNGRANSGITDRALGTLLEPRSAFADAFRNLYQGVAFSQTVQHLRTVMITSTAPAEGKSTIAANLAVTAAQAGKRVLLVDADFRRATQHRVFGVPREPGLTHHLLGLNALDEVIRETRVPGLSLLPAGILPPNPSEVLGGDALREVLHQLGEEYDLVVVDTAPLASTGDALALAGSTDGVILAVRVGRTDREAARGSVRTLSMAGARVLGAVVSDPVATWRNGRAAASLAPAEV